MSRRRDFLLCLLVAALPAMVLLSPGDAQIRALPANTAMVDPAAAAYPRPGARILDVQPLGVAFPATAEPAVGVVPLPDDSDAVNPAAWWRGSSAVPTRSNCCTWQLLPDGLMFKSYFAGGREPRFSAIWFYEPERGWLWDSTLGGRVGILRRGTLDAVNPQGWQLDIEGASFPRLDTQRHRDLVSVDFRFGIPLTARHGNWETKFAYYHLSSHMGDEEMVFRGSLGRRNYSRDALVYALGYFLHPDLRVYAEAGWAFYTDGGTEPWEFQFGVDYSPAEPSTFYGAPFFAVNGRIREEVDYGGNFTVQTGWQWRGYTGHVFRAGLHYFNGMSDQYQFFDQFEEQLGFGLWYDY